MAGPVLRWSDTPSLALPLRLKINSSPNVDSYPFRIDCLSLVRMPTMGTHADKEDRFDPLNQEVFFRNTGLDRFLVPGWLTAASRPREFRVLWVFVLGG